MILVRGGASCIYCLSIQYPVEVLSSASETTYKDRMPFTNLQQHSDLRVPLPDHGPVVDIGAAAYDGLVVSYEQLGVHVHQLSDGLVAQHGVRAQAVERDVLEGVRDARFVQTSYYGFAAPVGIKK